MKQVKVVIGKNFGDEGKGAAVHRVCVGKQAVVVRHNGGAQAGHTVEEGNFRFVFHQMGSGSLAGCHTFWSRTFLPDLLKLDEEVEGFRVAAENILPGAEDLDKRAGQKPTDSTGKTEKETTGNRKIPQIYAHPECACTVIYDVLLNSLTETLRGSAKHGSCGMGIYEATRRNQQESYTLRLKDFAQLDVVGLVSKLQRIREEYTRPQVQNLHKEYGAAFDRPEIAQWVELIEDENVLWNATEQMYENYHKYVELKDWQEIWEAYDTIVFENAQGLMLDRENEEYYPHLTPSYTGLYNIVNLLREVASCKCSGEWTGGSQVMQGRLPVGHAGNRQVLPERFDSRSGSGEVVHPDCELEVLYVTRSYVTRHGMGRLDYECTKEEINPRMVDKTNVPNPWQDALRYAKHPDGEEFWKYIRKDLQKLQALPETVKVSTALCVNHLDETRGKVLFAEGAMSLAELQAFCKAQGMDKVYAWYPT